MRYLLPWIWVSCVLLTHIYKHSPKIIFSFCAYFQQQINHFVRTSCVCVCVLLAVESVAVLFTTLSHFDGKVCHFVCSIRIYANEMSLLMFSLISSRHTFMRTQHSIRQRERDFFWKYMKLGARIASIEHRLRTNKAKLRNKKTKSYLRRRI